MMAWACCRQSAVFRIPDNSADVAYFFPLMRDVERRLGFRLACGGLI